MKHYLPIILILLCTSCIQIGSDPKPMHYYLLESMPVTTSAHSSKTLNIDIELTKFPEYLDKQQIATSTQTNGIAFSETNRWAEPLQDNLMFSVRENLALLLPNANIAVSPWESSDPAAFKLKLLVNKFSGKLGASAKINIRWSIGNNKSIVNGHFTYQQPIGSSYRDLVAELNKGLNQFSSQLAKKLVSE